MMRFGWTGGAGWRRRAGVIAALAMLPSLLAVSAVDAAAIRSVAALDDRIVMEFDGGVSNVSTFLLDGPQRIAVDLDGAQPGGERASGGVVAAIRQGPRGDGARVVFDLAEPAVVTDAIFAADGRSLTLKVKPASATRFSADVRAGRQTFAPTLAFRGRPPRGGDRTSVRVPLEPPAPSRALPTPPVTNARASNRPLVVIDAGHGGHDPGSLSADGKRREKDVALSIAKAIRDTLAESGRVRVALTREDDRFLVLGERREIARRLKADLFISVHADSAPNDRAHGATVYTLSEVASDQVAARLAARENRADVLNGVNLGGENSDVSSILFDLAQRETMNVSADFANLLQRQLADRIEFRSEAHKFAGFVVLKAPDVPSVLLETGFISNPEDEKRLFSRDYQRAIAAGVSSAVETHFARRLAAK